MKLIQSFHDEDLGDLLFKSFDTIERKMCEHYKGCKGCPLQANGDICMVKEIVAEMWRREFNKKYACEKLTSESWSGSGYLDDMSMLNVIMDLFKNKNVKINVEVIK